MRIDFHLHRTALASGRRFALVASILTAAIVTASCSLPSNNQTVATGKSPPAPLPWYLGADISPGGRGGTANYRDVDGTPGTEISVMKAHGWNAFRLRVFLSPVRGAPNNSLENTIPIAKQIKAAGCTFMLDIHYSDTWADPQHQNIPAAWQGLSVEQVEQKVEDYTRDVIVEFTNAGAAPDMVQVGNEITGGILWPLGHVQVPVTDVKTGAGRIDPLPVPYDDGTQWANFLRFLKAGTRGVRAATAEHPAKIVIHIDCGGDWVVTKWFFDHMTAANVDYDIIGQSFYPNYHGTLAMMQQNLAETFNRYHKPIMIAETGYPQAGATTGKYMQWPGTQQGQLQFMVDLVNTVKRDPHAMGVFYWAPEGSRGNGMWKPDGAPAPSILVNDHSQELTTRPASKMPETPAVATQPK